MRPCESSVRLPPMELEHPLPPGMRDLLPEEAASRRAIARSVMGRFELHGYRVVTPPAFEFADVIERGLGTLGAADVLRFIEPESGEVAVLRPDMTPQIARIVATRLADHAPPFRLAYEGTVVRRRIGRAKKHRQIPQVGVELCGLPGLEGDLELLALAADALRAAGLGSFTIDIADAGIVRGLLEGIEPALAEQITGALARKDEAILAELVADATRLSGKSADVGRVVPLARLHGGREALVEALRVLAGTRAEEPAKRLLALFDAAAARGLSRFFRADAGEVRGFAYYTGTIFSVFAGGPGEPIGGGGRYDDLLSRFGVAMPAVGFGIDVDALAWALRAAGRRVVEDSGIVAIGGEEALLTALRARGVAAVAASDRAAAEAYARSWGFARVVDRATLPPGVEEAADAAMVVVRNPAAAVSGRK
jgi:ATP phosphoribosyltransferase regulatory subunit